MIDCHYAPPSFDRAQFVGMSKTYSANNRVTDSAAGGTAIACGVKTNNSMLGMTADTVAVPSIAALAKKKGLSTGIVVSSYVLDATPGAFFAHVPKRGMRKEIIDDYLKERPDILVGGEPPFICGGLRVVELAAECQECYLHLLKTMGVTD